MRKMIIISLAQRADIVNLDSCCLYTNREVANSAAALSLHNYYVFHGRVTLFFANNFLTQRRITMKFLHNFF